LGDTVANPRPTYPTDTETLDYMLILQDKTIDKVDTTRKDLYN
jgi:hypothetical protein